MLKVAGKDTSFVILSHLVSKILGFWFFKMADGGHLGFCAPQRLAPGEFLGILCILTQHVSR